MANTPALDFSRRSRSGLNIWSGTVWEEWLRDLRGPRGVKIYREMADNEPVVGAMLFVLRMMIRGVPWKVVEGDEEDETLSEAGELIQSCMDDMYDMTWDDFIDEALSHLEFGWAAHEILWKRRSGTTSTDPYAESQYVDGRIGWGGLPLVGQETLNQWVYDGGILKGFYQNIGTTDPVPATLTTGRPFIPREKMIHFRTTKRKGNPEGRSILRNAYRPWYFKKNIEMFEGIGIERDLAGMPVLHVPPDLLVPNPPPQLSGLREALEKMIQEVKRDEREGILVPNEESGYKFELLSAGGARQFDTGAVIERKTREILFSVMADFIALGHEQVGSFALSMTKTGMFTTAVNAILESMQQTLNADLIYPTLVLNGMLPTDPKLTPRLVAGTVSVRDVTTRVESLAKLSAARQLPFDPVPALANAILRDLDLPEVPEEDFKRPEPTIGPNGQVLGAF